MRHSRGSSNSGSGDYPGLQSDLQGLGSRVQGLWGLGFRVQGLAFRVGSVPGQERNYKIMVNFQLWIGGSKCVENLLNVLRHLATFS